MLFDHFAVAGESLDAAVAHVEDALGLSLSGGGKHPHFGTHNKLLGLGPFYLEAIAIDPDAAPLPYPRWFALDEFAGAARISNWICQTQDFTATQSQTSLRLGDPVSLQRDDLRWTMLVPDDGCLPFDGACPGVIDWGQTPHPAARLPDVGARLQRLTIAHPNAVELSVAIGDVFDADIIRLEVGDALGFEAVIDTTNGRRVLT